MLHRHLQGGGKATRERSAGWQSVASHHAGAPGAPTHRESVGDAATRVDRAEAPAAQHGAHLVHLLEALLVRLGCGGTRNPVGDGPKPLQPSPRPPPRPAHVPGCRIFTGRWSTPPGPQRCAREPNLDSSIAGGLACGAASDPSGTDAGGRSSRPQTARRIPRPRGRALSEAVARRSYPVAARKRVDGSWPSGSHAPAASPRGFGLRRCVSFREGGAARGSAPSALGLLCCAALVSQGVAGKAGRSLSVCQEPVARGDGDPSGLACRSRVAEAHGVPRLSTPRSLSLRKRSSRAGGGPSASGSAGGAT